MLGATLRPTFKLGHTPGAGPINHFRGWETQLATQMRNTPSRYAPPGAHIEVRGKGIENKFGRMIEIGDIADKKGKFSAVKKPKVR